MIGQRKGGREGGKDEGMKGRREGGWKGRSRDVPWRDPSSSWSFSPRPSSFFPLHLQLLLLLALRRRSSCSSPSSATTTAAPGVQW